MGKKQSLRSKAAHFVSDLTTVLLNPISDNINNKPSKLSSPPSLAEEEGESESRESESEGSHELVDGPDTSSFTAFLYSLLASSPDSGDNAKPDEQDNDGDVNIIAVADDGDNTLSDSGRKENIFVREGLFSANRLSLSRAIRLAAKMGGFRHQDWKDDSEMRTDNGRGSKFSGVEMGSLQAVKEPAVSSLVDDLLGMSEPSMLISDDIRNAVYDSLPVLIHGRKWLLLYSTWKNGISLSTLYRRSMVWPGLSLLVVGDLKGAVFGGLVEAPLRPSNKRKYQGSNNSFVFTNTSGCPVIYRPTGVNRYFTLCTTDFLAIGGGGHFALYLDGDLLNGSSSVSETYGNSCLAHSQDFEVKEVELWGFVFPSQYEDIMSLSRTEAPGICRW